MSIIHIVLFRFKPHLEPKEVLDVCDRMLALKHKCVHPETKLPYIKAFTGGLDNSPEKISRDITHGFVVEFKSAADRDYYVHSDPAHLAFVESLEGILEIAQVIDYTPGVFNE
ncbi:Dimeric alpha-beta barrel [Penicillium sp. IBT 35674x]|nr:Dimeric alpha-beta barrel [Penicillium sp. IBT 35674x]